MPRSKKQPAKTGTPAPKEQSKSQQRSAKMAEAYVKAQNTPTIELSQEEAVEFFGYDPGGVSLEESAKGFEAVIAADEAAEAIREQMADEAEQAEIERGSRDLPEDREVQNVQPHSGEAVAQQFRNLLREEEQFEEASEAEVARRMEEMLQDGEVDGAEDLAENEEGIEAEDDPGGDEENDVDEEAEDDEDESLEDPDRVVFKIKEDGEEFEITAAEAKQGYLRQKAFTKKTQVLADEKRAAQEVQRTARAERDSLAQDATIVGAVYSSIGSLADKYSFSAEDRQAIARVIQGAANGALKINARNAVEDSKADADYLAEQETALRKARGLKSDEDATAYKMRLAEGAMQTYGFSAEELSQVADARVLEVLSDALNHRSKSKTGKYTRGKDGKFQKVTLRPGTSTSRLGSRKGISQKKALQEAEAKARRTGSLDDHAKVFERILEMEGF